MNITIITEQQTQIVENMLDLIAGRPHQDHVVLWAGYRWRVYFNGEYWCFPNTAPNPMSKDRAIAYLMAHGPQKEFKVLEIHPHRYEPTIRRKAQSRASRR